MIPILVQPVSIKVVPPEVEEIAATVRNLQSDRVGGPSGIKQEQLKAQLRAATREKEPDTERWEKVVSFIQVALREGYITEALMWTTMVLIPKGKWQYRGIGLVETIWKVCTSIVNSQLQSSILLHEVIHGFRKGRGTGTAIIESKLEQQFVGIVNEPLFQVFIDVRKA